VVSAAAAAQESVSPLPPPVTRSLYRGHWFAFLNAHWEDDVRAAENALAEMKKAARAVGVRRLSDFSRTAVHEARKAESLGKHERADRAYEAAFLLDDANYDAVASRIESLLRRGSYVAAAKFLPRAAGALFATKESRLTVFSSLVVWTAFAVGLAALGLLLVLLLRHLPGIGHDVRELARHFVGEKGAVPLGLLLFGLPLAFGLGPAWAVLYWGALLYASVSSRERAVLTAGLLTVGLLPPLLAWVARENIIRRSPLYLAAVDLEERREDQSAEDGLKQASAVFSEDPDVWFLLGGYAERSGDSERALRAYDRAIQAEPGDYRHFLNRGNVRFQEGEFATAIRDYREAAKHAPDVPQIHYNLSLASGEAYDFAGQAAAIARAKELAPALVDSWTQNPTALQRVIAAPYTLSRARARVEKWNAQPKSRRLPGHARPYRVQDVLRSPFTLAPWGALLLGALLTAFRSRWPTASECARCGAVFCGFCKRHGEPSLYCNTCVRLHMRREDTGIQAHVVAAEEARRRNRSRDRKCRWASLLFPGAHRVFSDSPVAGFLLSAIFFLFIAAAVSGDRLFNLRPLTPMSGLRWFTVFAAAAAFALWVAANVSAWRKSHGP